MQMGLLVVVTAALIVILVRLYLLWKKLRRELRDFQAAAREMRAEFEGQLKGVAAYIYNRPTRVLPSVEHYQYGRRFWEIHYRILFAIRLTDERDLEIVEPMSEQYVLEYLARPDNVKYRARICCQVANVPATV